MNSQRVGERNNQSFLFAIEDAFQTPSQDFVVIGTLLRGRAMNGDEVEIVGLRPDVIQTNIKHVSLKRGEILLERIERGEVCRGMVLASPQSIKAHCKFEAELHMLSKDEGGRVRPFFADYRPQFFIHNLDCALQIKLPAGLTQVMPGDTVNLEIELITPVALELGSEFVLREGTKIVGRGRVTALLD